MKKNESIETVVEKFLMFNDKEILFRKIKGQYWVDLKPICEALNVNYDRAYQNLKKIEIIKDVYATQHMHDSLKREQEMISLPEFYVYGWIFELNGKSEEYKIYKWKCYEILHLHFNGTITKRSQVLEEVLEDKKEKTQIIKRLKESDDYKRLLEIKENTTIRNRTLRKLDADLVSNQTEIKF